MGIAYCNVPSIYVDSGTIKPGRWKGQDLTVVSAFEAVGAYSAGKMSREDFEGIEQHACPGFGVCGAQYTANTMATAAAALGLGLLDTPLMAAEDAEKLDSLDRAAQVLVKAIELDLKPRDIINRKSLSNAVAIVMATGGSTNAVLHFLAIAKAAGVHWDIDDFERVARRTPVLCDLKPSGRFVAVDFHRAGGVPQVMKMLLDHDRLDGDCMTITGRTLAEELANVPSEPRGDQEVIRPWDKPLYDRGHLSILKGNLSPEGCVAKTSGIKQPEVHRPGARFRLRARLPEGDPRQEDQAGRRHRHPLRGPEGRAWHARDAVAHRRAGRAGAARFGRADHRRAVLRRLLGLARRARRARSVRRRHHRAGEERRHDHPRPRPSG